VSAPRCTVYVAEDEPLARESLLAMLEQRPQWDVIGAAGDGQRALEDCAALRPDLLLADIRLPRLDGLALVAALRQHRPALRAAFVTAYDQHAIEAFRVAAIDYLLKPVGDAALDACLARAADDIARERRLATLSAPEAVQHALPRVAPPPPRRLAIRSVSRVDLVPLDEIVAFIATGNYVEVVTRQRRYLHRQTMKSLAAQLDPAEFVRTHRGAIAAIDRIRGLDSRAGNVCLLLDGGVRLPVSTRYRDEVERTLARRTA
jgi:two-component system, LytTR family, response regulator